MRSSLTSADKITIAALALAGVVWAVRLEGRVNANDVAIVHVDTQRKESIEQIRADLTYIRTRIDQLLDAARRSAE